MMTLGQWTHPVKLQFRFGLVLSLAVLLAGLFFLQVTRARADEWTDRPTVDNAEAIIDSIQIEGVPTEWVESVRAMVGILPGESHDQKRSQRAIEKLKEYFQNKGYIDTLVDARFHRLIDDPLKRKTALSFRVKLGQPIRMKKLNIKFLNGSLSPEQILKIRAATEFKDDEAFDRDRLKEMKRGIEGALSLLSFIDSRVVSMGAEPASDGVVINAEVELGQRVSFSIQGSVFFTRAELMTTIEAQRLVGLGRDYVTVLSGILRTIYVDQGFRQVKITPYSFEPRLDDPKKILFYVDEGPRSVIRRLKFDGNEAFTAQELEGIYFLNAPERVQARVYNEKMVDDAAKSMIEEVRRKGYLSAKLVALRTEDVDDRGGVQVHLFLSEGLQTRVRDLQFTGNAVLTTSELTDLLGVRTTDPMNLLKLEVGIENIKRAYRDRGYLSIHIESEANQQLIRYSEKDQIADLSFTMIEGAQYRLADVQILGNEKTARDVIHREIQIETDGVLVEKSLIESEDRLRRLGIFSQVSTSLVDHPNKQNYKSLQVTVQEATPGNAGFGVGFRNDLGVRFFNEITYANLWGKNHSWVFNASANRRLELYRFVEYFGQVSYIWPWFTMGETTFRPTINIEKRQYIQFDAETLGLSVGLDRPLWKKIGLSGGLTYSVEKIRQFEAVSSDDNQQLRIGAITPNLRVDLRDNPLMPRRGFYGITSLEYAHPSLGSQTVPVTVEYARFQLRLDGYIEPVGKLVWFNSFRGGWLKNLANIKNENGQNDTRVKVPLIKQFALGGVNSLRGFRLQEINVQTQDIQGSLTFVNYRTQFDYFVTQNISFGPFLDAGNLNIDHLSLGKLRYGTGVGLRVATPVGPVNFDWGVKLFPKSGEDPNLFYFSLGVI